MSRPIHAVTAAHDALRDVLTLSVVTTDSTEGSKSKSRLRKELLQTCIRPVLLNLRDYTRLSTTLLRGLSQLLSLLSSWFNKTLGEKFLDHLQKWYMGAHWGPMGARGPLFNGSAVSQSQISYGIMRDIGALNVFFCFLRRVIQISTRGG